jgi:predicted nucleic-acid-binding protein
MIHAFDTNVLLRLYLNDDELQHAAVKRVMSQVIKKNQQVWISCPVLCELIWALRRIYQAEKQVCLETLECILETPVFVVESAATVRQATQRYRDGAGDFADYLIRELAVVQGVGELLTFDKALLKEQGFSKP